MFPLSLAVSSLVARSAYELLDRFQAKIQLRVTDTIQKSERYTRSIGAYAYAPMIISSIIAIYPRIMSHC